MMTVTFQRAYVGVLTDGVLYAAGHSVALPAHVAAQLVAKGVVVADVAPEGPAAPAVEAGVADPSPATPAIKPKRVAAKRAAKKVARGND